MEENPNTIGVRTAVLADLQAMLSRPVMDNSWRGHFAEVLVHRLLGSGWRHVGGEWGPWDLEHESGCRVQVRHSAAEQAWAAGPAGRCRPRFSIAPAKGHYVGAVWTPLDPPVRLAHLYIFPWHPVTGPETDQTDPGQWIFYAVPSRDLPDADSIGLPWLERNAAISDAAGLRACVHQVAGLPFETEDAAAREVEPSGYATIGSPITSGQSASAASPASAGGRK